MDFKTEILKSIETMIDRKLNIYQADHTYKSVIKNITKKGYVVLDNAGSERTVRCCIPGAELRIGQKVWIKEPMGKIMDMHICGVVLK